MYGNIPYMFDCWDDPVVHLLLLKSSMDRGQKREGMERREGAERERETKRGRITIKY